LKKIINDRGSVSVEAIISFQIFIICVLNLNLILDSIVTYDKINGAIYKTMININKISYLEQNYKKLNIQGTYKTIFYKNYKNRKNVEIENITINENEGCVYVKVRYIYNYIAIKKQCEQVMKMKLLGKGKSLYIEEDTYKKIKINKKIWNLSNLERGLEIAKILGKEKNIMKNVDLIKGGEAVFIFSINLMLKTYKSIEAVERKIEEYIEVAKKSNVTKKFEIALKTVYIVVPKSYIKRSAFKNYLQYININVEFLELEDEAYR